MNKQNFKRLRFTGLILFILAALFIFYYFLPKKVSKIPKEITRTEKVLLQEKAPQPETTPSTTQMVEGEHEKEEVFAVPEEIPQGQGEAGAKEKKPDAAHFIAHPKEIKVQVDEGERAQTEFRLFNDGTKTGSLNVYKTDLDESSAQTEERVEQLINYKKGILGQQGVKQDLGKAALFSGTPCLIPYPMSASLEPQEARAFTLTVDAADLEEKEYRTNLIILGLSKEELLILPVIIEVRPAPKIQLSKIVVDDGISAGAKGNANHVANPGEIVALDVYLENIGNAPAEDVTLELSPDAAPVMILGNNKITIPYVEPKSQFSERFLIEVPADSHPVIPPNVILTITDRDGRTWTENFYVGDPDKIQYPMGALIKDKKPEKKMRGNFVLPDAERQETQDELDNASGN